MLPIIILAAGAYGLWHHQKSKKPGSGSLTPAAAQVHGHLMGYEFNPNKLEGAAREFKARGLGHQARELNGKAAQIRQQAKVAGELVERARARDQNAMGMIAAIREEAAKGSPRAIVSAGMIAKYCQKNPMPEPGPLGESPDLPPELAVAPSAAA